MAERTNLDELIDNFTKNTKQKKPRAPASRKGTNKLRAETKPPSKDVVALLDEGTMAYNVATMLKRGYTMHEAAEKYGISDEKLKTLIKQAMNSLAEETNHILLNFVYLSMSRCEIMLQTLFYHMNDTTGTPNLDVIDKIRDVMKDQKTILELAMPKDGQGGRNPLMPFTPTMNSNSPIYEEGNKDLNQERREPAEAQEVSPLDNIFSGHAVPVTRTE